MDGGVDRGHPAACLGLDGHGVAIPSAHRFAICPRFWDSAVLPLTMNVKDMRRKDDPLLTGNDIGTWEAQMDWGDPQHDLGHGGCFAKAPDPESGGSGDGPLPGDGEGFLVPTDSLYGEDPGGQPYEDSEGEATSSEDDDSTGDSTDAPTK